MDEIDIGNWKDDDNKDKFKKLFPSIYPRVFSDGQLELMRKIKSELGDRVGFYHYNFETGEDEFLEGETKMKEKTLSDLLKNAVTELKNVEDDRFSLKINNLELKIALAKTHFMLNDMLSLIEEHGSIKMKHHAKRILRARTVCGENKIILEGKE